MYHVTSMEVELIAAWVEYLAIVRGYKWYGITVRTGWKGQLAALVKRLGKTCSVSLTQANRDALLEAETLTEDELHTNGSGADVPLSSMLGLSAIDVNAYSTRYGKYQNLLQW